MLRYEPMRERLSQERARIEKFGDVTIQYESDGIGILRHHITQLGYVRMGNYDFSNKGILFTVGALTCSVIVARKGEMWGLYHGIVDPESRNWAEDTHDKRLLNFLKEIRSINSEGESDFAFLFGARETVFEIAVQSRIEAEKALVEIANFQEDRVISRWNDDRRRSSVDVMVNPISSHIYVESVLR